MTPLSECWIVVADGFHIRVLEERRRHGDLALLDEWTTSREDQPALTDHGRSPREFAEHRFIGDLGARLVKAAKANHFEHLVLMAPAKTLGLLKDALEPIAARIELADHHERTHDTISEIRQRLQHLRLPA